MNVQSIVSGTCLGQWITSNYLFGGGKIATPTGPNVLQTTIICANP